MRSHAVVAFLVFVVVAGIFGVTIVVQSEETERTRIVSAADVQIARIVVGTRTEYSAQTHRGWRSEQTTSLPDPARGLAQSLSGVVGSIGEPPASLFPARRLILMRSTVTLAHQPCHGPAR